MQWPLRPRLDLLVLSLVPLSAERDLLLRTVIHKGLVVNIGKHKVNIKMLFCNHCHCLVLESLAERNIAKAERNIAKAERNIAPGGTQHRTIYCNIAPQKSS